MHITLACVSDLKAVQKVFEKARLFMRKSGNPNQWLNGYPQDALLLNDIEKKQLYIIRDDDYEMCGAFVFMLDEEPSYNYIEGAWRSNTPYGTIHRIASNGRQRGIFKLAVDYCSKIQRHMRIDTHKDNIHMQKLILDSEFEYCGIIYLKDGDMRLAYERL